LSIYVHDVSGFVRRCRFLALDPTLDIDARLRHSLDEKSRTDQHICVSWSGLDFASLNHIKPRQYRLAIGRAGALMYLSKDTV
jgi:hypothetical protein